MGNMVIDEDTGLVRIDRSKSGKNASTGKPKDKPKPLIVGADGKSGSLTVKDDGSGMTYERNGQDAEPKPEFQFLDVTSKSEESGEKLGNGKFEWNSEGYLVESQEGKEEREKRKKGSTKLLIAGIDPEVQIAYQKAKEDEMERRRLHWEALKKKYRGGKCYQTKDGFFIFETRPGQIAEIKKKEKEREKEEKRKAAEEKKRKREEEKKRKAEEKKKKQEAEAERRRKKKQDEANKKNGTYAGDGFHYEQREIKLVGGGSLESKVVVPNDVPKPKIVY